MEPCAQPLFRELQRFRQRWLWGTLLAQAVLFSAGACYLAFQWVILERPVEGTCVTLVAVAVAALSWGAVAVLALGKLTTEVRQDGLYVRFAPFHKSFRRIPLEKATDVRVVRYRPIVDYGGWGLRWVPGARCYTVSGNQGLRVKFGRSYHILIGSQQPEELLAALGSVMPALRTCPAQPKDP